MVTRGLQGVVIVLCALAGFLLAAKLRLGAGQSPCRDTVEVPGVVAACLVEQAAWWGLTLGAVGGALVAVAAVVVWGKGRGQRRAHGTTSRAAVAVRARRRGRPPRRR